VILPPLVFPGHIIIVMVLGIDILITVMLSVFILSVFMVSVVAPFQKLTVPDCLNMPDIFRLKFIYY